MRFIFLAFCIVMTQSFAIEQKPRFWTTWNGTYSRQIPAVFIPKTREELVTLVQMAYAKGGKIKVLGAGHSLNAISLPEEDGWTLSLEEYTKILEVDEEHQTITVQGGATLKQINEALYQHGLALENLGSISDQTIGGVIQTGTHGTGINYGPIHTQILAMTVITGKGESKALSPTTTPLLFRAYQCGLGTLGIIDTVTLRAIPATLFHEQTCSALWPELLDQLDELVQNNDHFRFYWFPFIDCAGTWTANPTTSEFNASSKNTSLSSDSSEDFLELGPDDPAILKRFNRALFEKDYGEASERIDRSDRIFNVDCGAHAHCRAMEVAFPFRYTKPFLSRLQKLVEENHFPAHGGVEVRFVRGDTALISPTYSENPEDLFCFVSIVSILPNSRPISYQPYFQAFQNLAEEYQGRLHWGKMGEFNPARIKDAYPHWTLFKDLQKQEDPSGVFLNQFTAALLDQLK
jgi:L-gulonolactone oxidase